MKTKYKGLCECCVHAPECTFPRNPDRSVLCCDEFEGITKSAQEQECNEEPAAGSRQGGSDAEPKGAPSLKGLCRTCSKADTCTYPKPEGGVWHCDEYE